MQTAIKQRPILFSTPMVQAILEGRKTMTRRTVKPMNRKQSQWLTPELLNSAIDVQIGRSHEGNGYGELGVQLGHPKGGPLGWIKCPHGNVGDVLWVRETFVKGCTWDGEGEMPPLRHYYRADKDWVDLEWYDEEKDTPVDSPKWKPSIFMPKEACHLFLRITDIRVERLQDISEEDAMREGIELVEHNCFKNYDEKDPYQFLEDPIGGFRSLWESINGPGSWDANPFVWKIKFIRINKPE